MISTCPWKKKYYNRTTHTDTTIIIYTHRFYTHNIQIQLLHTHSHTNYTYSIQKRSVQTHTYTYRLHTHIYLTLTYINKTYTYIINTHTNKYILKHTTLKHFIHYTPHRATTNTQEQRKITKRHIVNVFMPQFDIYCSI